MAPSSNQPTSADKGKGKAVESQPGDKKTKDAQPSANGKKDEDKVDSAEDLSEEDQQLKSELDMLVERLTESDASLYKPALEAMKTSIKTSTSSMTAVPKPLKFLRPHYETMTKLYDEWPEGEDKSSLADVLSVIGMTFSDEDRQDTLKYRLLSPTQDIGSWGHEYVRHLALEIGEVYAKRVTAEESVKDLVDLALILVPLFLKSNAEADAVDLMSELEIIEDLPKFVDENTYSRVCLYLVSMVNLLTYPENEQFLRTAYTIYTTYKEYTQAMVIAIRLNDVDLINSVFNSTSDPALKKQMAFLIGRQKSWVNVLRNVESHTDAMDMEDAVGNVKLAEYFKTLGKALNILEPKTTEDIYKSHLESSRVAGMTNLDSARHNLAAAFVNAFVNAGYGNDKMMLVEQDKESWVWKTKDEGMVSTVASLGTLLMWDVETGLDKIDKFTYSTEPLIVAGSMLAIGIMTSGVRIDSDPGLALLGDTDKLESKHRLVRITAIMGLGLSYAGSHKEEVLELLIPIITNPDNDMQIVAMAALSLGLVYVGSANPLAIEEIMGVLLDDERGNVFSDKWFRFLALGLGLLFFGRQEEVDVILETLKAVSHPMARPTAILCEVCAWAGTGAVLKIQELLHICNEHYDADSGDKDCEELLQMYAVLGIALVAMGEDVGQEMVLRQFGHLMHYGEANIRRVVPLAMALISPSNPQMKVYDTLSRYSHDNDNDVAINAIFAMGLLGAGTNNARLAQLLRQLASYYHRDQESLFMVRIAQGLLHMGKGTMTLNPFHTDRQILSRVATSGLLATLVAMIDAKQFITSNSHYLLYYLITAMHPRFLVTLDENLRPLTVNVRVGQAVDVVGQAGRPKTITGWQTQSTPVLLAYGERAELEDEKYISLSSTLEGLVILRENPEWEGGK
ncbi:26S proteasome regulatory complex, non-ATPase subcomplex, Rpn1 subunit [Daldinia caldariorum]|uniref:26S proteasome regulatory complex, non-ATPase subcomplex, Rpn1 subunit n=1 Tax=Daldinia caldariorum TaxID=326644 RepID=UPI0020088587|nr:26S proteasome regulatory complex, non-ATPase subcomplex, Rpn1 subunit [Daldinia caldariorum]KAI1470677.1 26S proteasome regulatory complex, non-ATPase subcomplex, Rpn1 subunit [Daldinia caldariorum]